MSGFVQERAAHTVVRCSGVRDDGPCGREQAFESFESHDDGVGVCVASEVSVEVVERLSSFGWRRAGHRWLCPFCAGGLP